MNTHKNARLTAKGREQMVRAVLEGGLSKAAAARRYHTTPKTVGKWVDRFLAEGVAGLADRSSRPHSSPRQTPSATCAAVAALRRRRLPGKQIATELGLSPATVSRTLQHLGLNKLSALEPVEPVRRYERAHPGELIHLDIKKLGRIWRRPPHHRRPARPEQSARPRRRAWLGVCPCRHRRCLAHRLRPGHARREDAERDAFLKAALAYYASLGITVARVMTDNGACYKAFDFGHACRDRGLKHIRTKPYTPKNNGKAERFIQTALREWAYAQAYTIGTVRMPASKPNRLSAASVFPRTTC